MKQNAVSRAAKTIIGEKALLKYCNKCKMSINIPEMATTKQQTNNKRTPVTAAVSLQPS